MVADDELQGFILTERILDAVDFVPTVETRCPPAPDTSENRPVCRNEKRLRYGPARQMGLVELVCYTAPAEFFQRAMQSQLFWGANNRTPLQPIIAIGLKD